MSTFLRQIHQLFFHLGHFGPWPRFNLQARRKSRVCSAFNFNSSFLTSIQSSVKSLKFWPLCNSKHHQRTSPVGCTAVGTENKMSDDSRISKYQQLLIFNQLVHIPSTFNGYLEIVSVDRIIVRRRILKLISFNHMYCSSLQWVFFFSLSWTISWIHTFKLYLTSTPFCR